jgi:hypothetical protein
MVTHHPFGVCTAVCPSRRASLTGSSSLLSFGGPVVYSCLKHQKITHLGDTALPGLCHNGTCASYWPLAEVETLESWLRVALAK